MTISKTITATANVASKHTVLFGVNVAAVHADAPAPPPTAHLIVAIHDSLLTDGSGTLIAKMIISMNTTAESKQIIFPAGVRCGHGLSVIITATGWGDISVNLDFS